MIISRKSHDLIVAELRNQAVENKKAHDLVVVELRNQIASLQGERDFYRKEWTKTRGKAFTARADEDPPLPLFNQPPSEPERLDANWTVDDRDMFHKWSLDLPKHTNAEEEWRRLYGDSPPLIALTV